MRFRERFSTLKEKWDEKSKDFISGFMGLFGRDGRIVSAITQSIVNHNILSSALPYCDVKNHFQHPIYVLDMVSWYDGLMTKGSIIMSY